MLRDLQRTIGGIVSIDRRHLLKGAAALVPLAGALPRLARAGQPGQGKADYTLRIANGLVELGPDHIISTTLYNGQFPGPLLRFQEGKSVTIDIHNETDTPEQLHWHGQSIPPAVAGAEEGRPPFLPPHGSRRLSFTPRPAGF